MTALLEDRERLSELGRACSLVGENIDTLLTRGFDDVQFTPDDLLSAAEDAQEQLVDALPELGGTIAPMAPVLTHPALVGIGASIAGDEARAFRERQEHALAKAAQAVGEPGPVVARAVGAYLDAMREGEGS